MKIVFLTQSLQIGGAERQLVALARGLQKKGHCILVATFNGGSLERSLRNEGIRVVNFNKSGRWNLFPFLYRLIRVLRRERPDLLHGYLPAPNLLTILLKPVFPKIKMVWGVRAANVELSGYDRLVFRAQCLLSRYADLIIANSHAGRAYHYAHGFPGPKMVVVPNGIDTNYFKPDADAGSRKRAEWGITDSERVIGLVARLDPMKDHPTFLRAAAVLASQQDNMRFVCIGDGPSAYKSDLTKLAADLGLEGKLVWAGAGDDMPAIYNGFDAVVSSSSGEGFPNVLGEAMACGIPCVATDVGDSALIINDAKLIVKAGDPEAMASVIRSSLSSSSPAAMRKRIETNFSVAKLVDETEAVLNTICTPKAAAETVAI